MTHEPWSETAPWRQEVHRKMQQGLGTEDIAAALGLPVAEVEKERDFLREAGILNLVYGLIG